MKIETQELLEQVMLKPNAGYIATVDENGIPSIRAVYNLRCKEKFPYSAKVIGEYDSNPHTVYISTNTASVKVKHIKKNPNVAIYFSIPEEVKGVMLQGEAEIIDDMEFKKTIWEDDWLMFYPLGYTDPDFTMLKIKPKLLRGWYKGHHYHEFK